MAKKHCSECGAPMVEYKQGLCKGLAAGLRKALVASTENYVFHIGACGLSYSERENLRKLQYWNIISRVDPNSEKGGWWRITDIGLKFLSGDKRLPKYVWTYRGVVQRVSGKKIKITKITAGWKYQKDYAKESVPV